MVVSMESWSLAVLRSRSCEVECHATDIHHPPDSIRQVQNVIVDHPHIVQNPCPTSNTTQYLFRHHRALRRAFRAPYPRVADDKNHTPTTGTYATSIGYLIHR